MPISVVIAAYNAADTLERAIQSALNQSPRPEVVVVDDGSTDATWRVVGWWTDEYGGMFRPSGGYGCIPAFVVHEDSLEP